ncbi:DUF721 domain-containing protein [Canibacter zhoujuaniae]|uniref:DUF721 domain-containing protein n=1 Tax=Canibacter zhoujuaniae TaxID=2708343 RepID=UPI001420CC06|nr:DciA family protein [Canibacter zhoujuaniae]
MNDKIRRRLEEQYLLSVKVWGGTRKTVDEMRRVENQQRAKTQPFERGRDPQPIGKIVDSFMQREGFTVRLANAAVVANWEKIVGSNVAAHTEVQGLVNGKLVVACDSTAWATELRLLSSTIVKRLKEEYPDAQVRTVEVKAPGTVSWRHGRRVVPGRGPRDTYG